MPGAGARVAAGADGEACGESAGGCGIELSRGGGGGRRGGKGEGGADVGLIEVYERWGHIAESGLDARMKTSSREKICDSGLSLFKA